MGINPSLLAGAAETPAEKKARLQKEAEAKRIAAIKKKVEKTPAQKLAKPEVKEIAKRPTTRVVTSPEGKKVSITADDGKPIPEADIIALIEAMEAERTAFVESPRGKKAIQDLTNISRESARAGIEAANSEGPEGVMSNMRLTSPQEFIPLLQQSASTAKPNIERVQKQVGAAMKPALDVMSAVGGATPSEQLIRKGLDLIPGGNKQRGEIAAGVLNPVSYVAEAADFMADPRQYLYDNYGVVANRNAPIEQRGMAAVNILAAVVPGAISGGKITANALKRGNIARELSKKGFTTAEINEIVSIAAKSGESIGDVAAKADIETGRVQTETGRMGEAPAYQQPRTDRRGKPIMRVRAEGREVEVPVAKPKGKPTATQVPKQPVTPTNATRVNIGGKQLDLTDEAKTAYDSAKARRDERLANIDADTQGDKSGRKKAVNMEFSAEARRITGTLTDKERAAIDKEAFAINKGTPVSFSGREGVAQSNVQGKVTILFNDGTKATVPRSEVVKLGATEYAPMKGVKPVTAKSTATAIPQTAKKVEAPQTGAQRPQTASPVAPQQVAPAQQATQGVAPPKGATGYGASNYAQGELRKSVGLDALPESSGVARSEMPDYDPSRAGMSVRAINDAFDSNTKIQPLSDVETVELGRYSDDLANRIKATDDPEELSRLYDEFEDATLALQRVGTEQGRALASRNLLFVEDYTPAGLVRYFTSGAKRHLDPAERMEAERLGKEVSALQNQLDSLKAKLLDKTAKKSKGTVASTEVDKARNRLKSLTPQGGGFGSRQRGAVAMPSLSQAARIASRYAKDIRTLASDEMANGVRSLDDVIESIVKTTGGALDKDSILHALSYGDTAILRNLKKFEIEREAAKVEATRYRNELKREALRKANPSLKVGDWVGLPRTLLATGDLSAPLTQGIFHLFANPTKAAKSLPRMFSAVRSEKDFNRVLGEVRLNPSYQKAQAGRLKLSTGEMDRGEELFVSKLLGDLTSWSERGYSAYLNTLRMETFDSIVRGLEKRGSPLSIDELKDVAEYVNTTTGVGTGKAARGLTQLNEAVGGQAFFAPGYWVSRIKTSFGTPFFNAIKQKNYGLAQTILKDYAKVIGSVYGLSELAKAGGVSVEQDPRSSRFMKLNVGNVSVDPAGGLQQNLRIAYQLAKGTKTKTGAEYPPDFSRTLGYTATGKMGPIPRQVEAVIKGESFGKNTDPTTQEGLKNIGLGFLPITVQNWEELANDPSLTPEQKAMYALGAFFGLQTNVSDSGNKK